MVGIAERVTPIVCAHPLEAEVRELRLIAEHKPRYNRRSRFPERAMWLKLTVEPFPRLSLVREVRDDGATYLGPFSGARQAEHAMAALHEALPLRQCTQRLSPRRARPPARSPRWAAAARRARAARPSRRTPGTPPPSARRCSATPPARRRAVAQVARLAADERYEEAAVAPRPAGRLRPGRRAHAAAPALTAVAELVAARPRRTAAGRSSWSGTAGWPPPAVAGRGADPRGRTSRAWSRPPRPSRRGPGRRPAASAEEIECVLRWLEAAGTRLVRLTGTWASPTFGAGGVRLWAEAASNGRDQLDPFGGRRDIRPVHQPGAAVSRIIAS